MFQSTSISDASSFRNLGFAKRVWRCLERSERSGHHLTRPDRTTLLRLLGRARETMDIATDDAILAVIERNPDAILVSGTDQDQKGLLATLPLNSEGMAALCGGEFSGLCPDPAWISKSGERPEAIYVWLVFMPGSFGRLLGAISEALDRIMPQPCPLFSRATSAHSARLHQQAGFMTANSFFPHCQEGVQVVFPEQPMATRARSELSVRLARTVEDIFRVFSVRSATYIAEQYCLFDEEFDGNDFCSTQFLGEIDGDAAGCLRLRFFNGFAKLERLAVRREYRNSRLAYRLVREALEHCRLKGYTRIYGHSRLDLVRFWRVFGFQPMADRAMFSFANVQYVEILAELEPHPGAIAIGLDPLAMIRPEGAWDIPGPFDLCLSERDPRRKDLLVKATRTLGNQDIRA